jgi:hypothetical protein
VGEPMRHVTVRKLRSVQMANTWPLVRR